MKCLIAGSTGMVGKILTDYCLESHNFEKVYSLVRNESGRKHPKLQEVVIADFRDYTKHTELFENVDIAFFCIGVYTGQVPDSEFRKITVDYAVTFAEAVQNGSPGARLCLLSGAGADRSEKSRTAFAKYKGMAENRIAALNLEFYAFRPAYIYPVEKRREPNFGYALLRFAYPLLKLFGEGFSIKSTELARAMLNVGLKGADREILENKDILKYAHPEL